MRINTWRMVVLASLDFIGWPNGILRKPCGIFKGLALHNLDSSICIRKLDIRHEDAFMGPIGPPNVRFL